MDPCTKSRLLEGPSTCQQKPYVITHVHKFKPYATLSMRQSYIAILEEEHMAIQGSTY